MKTTEAQRQSTHPVDKPFTAYLALSAAAHGGLVLCMVGGAWLLGAPTYYKPSAYTVALVDAPLSLRQPTQAPRNKEPSGEPKERPEKRPSPDTKAVPKPSSVKPTAAPTKVAFPKTAKALTVPQKAKRKVVPTPKPTKTAKTTKKLQKKRQKATTPAQRTKSTSVAKSRQRQPRKSKQARGTETKRRRAVEQRLAALRARFGDGGDGDAAAKAAAGLQQVRLRAYQESVREQIVDAWILPLPQDAARNLQATALLTVNRDGYITQLELLKTSGNSLFDESLLRAIKQAEPLPVLPEDYRGEFLEVEMRFRPGDA
jgi:colicin import membrane protein